MKGGAEPGSGGLGARLRTGAARLVSAPFRSGGRDLPPRLLLIARLTAAVLLFEGILPFSRHLPYLEFLDHLGSPRAFRNALWLAAGSGHLLLFFTRRARLGCLLLGAGTLTGLLACRPCLSVAHTFVACLFLMLAASSPLSGPWLVRCQLVIVYAGATLAKALDVDWWNGRAMEALLVLREEHAPYMWLAERLPELSLSSVVGWAVVATQAALVLCFLRPRWYRVGVLLGTLFHGSMAFLVGGTFGPFVPALFAAYLAFVEDAGPAGGGTPGGDGEGRGEWAEGWRGTAAGYGAVFLLLTDAGGGWVRRLTLVALMGLAAWWYARPPAAEEPRLRGRG